MLYIDIETYSDIELRESGVYRYVESPNFEILFAWYAFDDDPLSVVFGWDEIREVLEDVNPGELICAHNAPFERLCFSAEAGVSFLPPEGYEDTAALAAAHGYPRDLDGLAKALGVAQKDTAGTALINWFCKPDKKTGQRRRPEDHPEKWAQFLEYGKQDVVVLREVHRKLPDWPDGEREVYLLDQRINDRGIKIDLDLAHAAAQADEEGRAEAAVELEALLGINNAGSVPQITKALAESGLVLNDLRADTILDFLEKDALDANHRRALELRQQIALVAARKYIAAIKSVSADGRLRGQFIYCGAHTGRWSSRGVQFQNPPRASLGLSKKQIQERGLTPEQVARIDEVTVEANILDLLLGHNPGPEVLKSLVRSLFVGPFTFVDYNAIEARFLAWIAGETWVLDAFRKRRDIYVEQATRMSTSREFTRQDGKIATLALGYEGGVSALRNMGAEGTDEELNEIKFSYRAANPKIKRLWKSLERAFIEGGTAGRLRVDRRGRDRHLVLPSGRALTYHNVSVTGSGFDRRILFDNPRKDGPRRMDTYGGRLVENATQAGCRDLLAEAMLRLEAAGLPVVGHVHDEVVVEGTFPVEEMVKIMCELPVWATGFPLDAEGFNATRYRKG